MAAGISSSSFCSTRASSRQFFFSGAFSLAISGCCHSTAARYHEQYTSSVEVVNVYACSLPVSIGTWPLAASACWPPSSNSCSGSQGPDSHIFAAVITTVVTHSNTRANIKPCILLRHTLRAGLQAGFPEHRTYNFANFAELGLRTDEMNNFVLGKEGKSLASLHT